MTRIHHHRSTHHSFVVGGIVVAFNRFFEALALYGELAGTLHRPVRPCRWLISIARRFAVRSTIIFRDDPSGLPTVEVRLIASRDRREGAMVVLKVVGQRLTAAHCRKQRPAACQNAKIVAELKKAIADDGGSLVGPFHSHFHGQCFVVTTVGELVSVLVMPR